MNKKVSKLVIRVGEFEEYQVLRLCSFCVLSYHILSYHIYSPSVDLYRYGMHHTVYISMQGICHDTIIHNTTVQFVIDT
jgi:hypothetical protein